MSEHTATITFSMSAQGSYSGPFAPTHIMFLIEASRPVWELHSLNECSAPVVRLIPFSPDTILPDGLRLAAAAITGDQAAVQAFMDLGHSPSDGMIDLSQLDSYVPVDDAMLRHALSGTHLGFTYAFTSSSRAHMEWITEVATDIDFFSQEGF